MQEVRTRMARHVSGLWRHADFLRFWAAQTASQFGAQVSALAVPLLAAVMLDATALEMGILAAASTVPHLLLALFAGVWADRRQRRPILIATDVGRAILLSAVPLTYVLGILRIEYLYLVQFFVGILTVFFDVAYQSYLPSLVPRDDLIEGNAKLQGTQSAALIIGPGIAGGLVALTGAPSAVTLTALTLVMSALLLARIRAPEPGVVSGHRAHLRAEIGEGLRFVISNPLLRAVAGYQATSNLFVHMVLALLILYATRTLGIGAGLLGLIFTGGSAGFLLGAMGARRIAHRFGPGPSIVGGATLMCTGYLLLPLARGPVPVAVTILVIGLGISGFGETIFGVNQMSLRQSITPDHLQGRMNATMRFLTWSSRPVGAVIGGGLGEVIGLQPALVVGALGALVALPWLYGSPLRTIREIPTLDRSYAD